MAVNDLDKSIGFYTSLFDSEPTVVKDDYAKWMLDDPRVNFAITTRGQRKGIDHLGIQVENEAELGEVYSRLQSAGAPVIESPVYGSDFIETAAQDSACCTPRHKASADSGCC
jgi:catechol 2,3-dioxygenase-like lactoylglutathione lyase family enzyme